MSTLQGNSGQLGKQVGQNLTAGFGEFSDLLVTELQSRYYQNTYRGLKYVCSTVGGGVQLAATSLFSTAIASFTPVLCLYNPITSLFNLVIEKIWCGLTAAPLATISQTGSFLLVGASGQNISNAQTAQPVNTKTFKSTGSQAIGISNVTLTGAVGNPTLLRPLSGDIEIVTATANTVACDLETIFEEVAGSVIIAPGSYLAIANGISNAVAGHLVNAGFEWDEVPV